jgi:cytochrome P450
VSISADRIPDDHDPFALFDEAVGIGEVDTPYPVYAEMRAECPVHVGAQWHRFGVDQPMEALLYGDLTPYTVLPFEAVQRVLRDDQTFSSTIMANLNGLVMGHTIIEMDQPEHRQYRGLIAKAFTPHAMQRWERDVVRPIVRSLVDGFVHKGRADLARDLFFPFPVQVIVAMMGLPSEDIPVVQRKAVELISILKDAERGLAASQWLYDYFAGVITARRDAPGEDLVTVLAQAELDGQKLTNDEIIAFLRLLLPAGGETTYRASSNLMVGLLSHPDQLEALRADRSLMSQTIDEALRWESPLTAISRITTRDAEVEGVTIPKGSGVHVCTGAANHDPSHWRDAEEFNIFREQRSNLAFGFGQHVCLGMHLARMEMTVVIGEVLDRLPNLRLDPDADEVRITGLGFRAPNHLPVLFDPA